MTAIVTRGDAGNLHLPDATVDTVITSPPYFGLRSYTDGGEHYEGQVGAEATPAEYLDALMACTAEWMRVLKPGGSIFVNLGDKYSSAAGPKAGGRPAGLVDGHHADRWVDVPRGRATEGARPKSLQGLPWRYAIRCIDELRLILRAEIVWAKPNGLPESVTDRVRRSHEQVFHFVKQPRYYSAVDEVREPHAAASLQRFGHKFGNQSSEEAGRRWTTESVTANPLGKLPGSVWTIPTAPLRVPESLGIDHFAAYPPELVRRIVLGWSPREVCTACGEGRRPVADRSERYLHRPSGAANVGQSMSSETRDGKGFTGNVRTVHRITGYACACPDTTAPATPGIVLDPFAGTGTSMLVASALGRVGIGVDLSADYCRLAQWRVNDPKQRAKVTGAKPPKAKKTAPAEVVELLPGQLDLLSGDGDAA